MKIVGNTGIFAINGVSSLLRHRSTQVCKVRLKIIANKPAQNYCQPQLTNTWFPVAPGVVSLPPAPSVIVNTSPLPPNAALAPLDFDIDNPNLCALFQDLLPVNSPPIYPEEQAVVTLAKPYNEIIKTIALVKTFIDTQRLNYPLRLDERFAVVQVKPILHIITLELNTIVASFTALGSDAIFSYLRQLQIFAAAITLGRPSTGLLKHSVVTGNSSSYSISGNVDLFFNRRLAAEIGAYQVGDGATKVTTGIYFTPDPVLIATTPETPLVSSGKAIFVPLAQIQIEAFNIFQAGKPRTEVFVPKDDISIGALQPLIGSGGSAIVPSSSIAVSSLLPQVKFIGVATGTIAPELGAVSATSFAGWTRIQNVNVDDNSINTGAFGFTFTLANTAYTSCFIGGNGYMTFGGASNIFDGISQSAPAFPKILFAPGDWSSQRVYTKTEPGGSIRYAAIRWEGANTRFGTPGSSTIIVEFRIFELFRGKQFVEIRFGINNATSSSFMIANATTAYATATSTANSSWVLEGNSTGTSWTMTSNRYIGL